MQSGQYFLSKQDDFLLYLAGKSRDQLFADLDTERSTSLEKTFKSLYTQFPQLLSNSNPESRIRLPFSKAYPFYNQICQVD